MSERTGTDAALAAFDVEQSRGLDSETAKARLAEYGRNEFEEKKKKTKLQMFFSQLKDPMIFILAAAVLISAFLREYSDAAIIVAVILLNAVIGTVQESKAERSLEALKKMTSPMALVRRNGAAAEIPAAELVPGDIVLLEAGRIVPADLRLLETVNLKVEESVLTGESVPVEKDAQFSGEDTASLGDRLNMAYMSTSVSYGRGEGVVVATGMRTEIGKIAQMIENAGEEMTPLQQRLADLGKLLGILAVVLCAALFALAIWQERNVMEMLLTAISLAVAAIPEGLPAVVTIVLALGVQRMVKVNTIVRKLPSVETLGAVSVVCSDKTGTLTQNRMTAVRLYVPGHLCDVSENALAEEGAPQKIAKEYEKLVCGLMYCTDAEIHGDARIGDPTELALLDLGHQLGLTKEVLLAKAPRINELAFDSERKMMTTVQKDARSGAVVSYTKGAVDCVLGRCTAIEAADGGSADAETPSKPGGGSAEAETPSKPDGGSADAGALSSPIGAAPRPITEADRAAINEAAHRMAADALRVLALCCKYDDETASENDLVFLGLVGMIDPPRPEAKEAIRLFRNASVRTVMITGDHKDTAFAIARELGIAEDLSECMTGDEISAMTEEEFSARIGKLRVFARVSPEHKVQIVNALRAQGEIVSMTGDGVNDAPSLKSADIGVAMGITGTDVSKGAADMILTDDNFATIEKAIEEGRNIYANIKKSVLFLLSSNLGEIVTMFTAILLGLAAPLKAIHILWVNLITDSLPGLALGVDTGDPDAMKKPPRDPKESLFAHGGYAVTISFGVLIGAVTLAAFLFPPVHLLLAQGKAISLSAISGALADEAVYRHAQTYAFTVLAIAQLFNALGMRSLEKSVFRMNPFRNKMMILALAVGFTLQILVTEVSFLETVFATTELSLVEWLALTAVSAAPLLLHELIVLFRYVRGVAGAHRS